MMNVCVCVRVTNLNYLQFQISNLHVWHGVLGEKIIMW